MRKKLFIILCTLMILPTGERAFSVLSGQTSEEINAADEVSKITVFDDNTKEEKIPEIGPVEQLNPERVLLPMPVAELNGEEGALSYRWGEDCISIDETSLLLSCDCYFSEEKLQQKIFYLAKAPDFEPREVFRQDSRSNGEGTEGIGYKAPELLEGRMLSPLMAEDGYLYELDGKLYCLSEDFEDTILICDIRKFMGELYQFSPWVPDKNKCDVTADISRMLACTDEGLYEYDLSNGEKSLLEPALFEAHEIVHIEGDCDCGEIGFEFCGPIEAEYAPDEQSYVFVTGNEYGDPLNITLRTKDGKDLYQKELEYAGGFEWIELEDAVWLSVFYKEGNRAWMDRVNVVTGENITFAVPDEVFWGNNLIIGFLDADSLIYCKKEVSVFYEKEYGKKGEYEIYRLPDGERLVPEMEPDKVNWKMKVLKGGCRTTILKLPEFSPAFLAKLTPLSEPCYDIFHIN